MSTVPREGERYTIRRKIFTVLGASFHIYGEDGRLVAFCRQKAFKLKEDFRFYADESRGREVFRVGARSLLDFAGTYDVKLPTGETIGTVRRKAIRSMFRDEWHVLGDGDHQIGRLIEDSAWSAFARRFLPLVAVFSPQRFRLETLDDRTIAEFRTHFNPFVHKLGVRIVVDDERFDDLMILAIGCLLLAIEGRQKSQ